MFHSLNLKFKLKTVVNIDPEENLCTSNLLLCARCCNLPERVRDITAEESFTYHGYG